MIGIIPARGGSKGIPYKNIHILNGYPLIAYSIAACKMTQLITRTIVSTDSDEIMEVSRRFGAETPFKRPDLISQDTSLDIDFIRHAYGWLKEHEPENKDLEYFAHIRPTTPLRDPKELDKAIEIMIKHTYATALRSVFPVIETPFKCFNMNGKNKLVPIGKDSRKEFYNLPRQAFPQVYRPNGVIDIIKMETVLKKESLHGKHILGFITINAGEVDSLEDFDYIEWRMSKYGSIVYDYLRKEFPNG